MMPTIEIIEEDIAMRTLLCEWLAAEGYRVRTRSHAGTAAAPDVDLVLVDLLDLPARGMETMRLVKKLYGHAALVGISTQLGRAMAADSAQARALGVDALVPKPCTRRELLDAVAGAVGRP